MNFKLDVLTPEYEFFSGEAESVTIKAPDGELCVLANHEPMVAPLEVGSIKIKINGIQKEAFNSEGFIEVTPEGVLVFTQACEWPENIDEKRAAEAEARAREAIRQNQSMIEYKGTKIALSRAMARLSVKRGYKKNR